MKKEIKIGVVGILSSIPFWGASAQQLGSGYFMENYTYRYQSNPAMSNDRPFFSLPAAGNIQINPQGNVGISDFIHSVEGDRVLFMDQEVKSESFLARLSDQNTLSDNADILLFALGFNAFGGYNTFTVNTHSTAQVDAPLSFFKFLKNGVTEQEQSFDLSSLHARARAYTSFGFGHSRAISERLRVGVTAKFLLGLGQSNVSFDHLYANLTPDQWVFAGQGELNSSFARNPHNYDENNVLTGFEIGYMDLLRFAGTGFAIDLGATYTLFPNLTISAAVLDLGYINWRKNYKAATTKGIYVNDPIEDFGMIKGPDNNSVVDQLKALGYDLLKLADFEDQGKQRFAERLTTTFNVGADYHFSKSFSFGLLYTSHVNKPYTTHEGRISANYMPSDWFAITGSASYGDYCGTSAVGIGGLINITAPGFGVFLGVDAGINSFKISRQDVDVTPLTMRYQVGINFPLGKVD